MILRSLLEGETGTRRTGPRSVRYGAAPTEPVTAADVIAWARIPSASETAVLDSMCKSARRLVEEASGHRIAVQSIDSWWDQVPCGDALTLPVMPLRTVTSIVTLSHDGTETTFSPSHYVADAISEPGRVVLKLGHVWPSDLRTFNALRVRYEVGYDADDDRREGLINAVKKSVAYWHEHRGDYEEKVGRGLQPAIPGAAMGDVWSYKRTFL